MSPRNSDLNEQMRKDALEKIVKAALTVFSEYGYHGATIKRITEASGLSYGLVYHYFASKEEVFSYLVNLALEQMQTIFSEALGSKGTAWEKLTLLSQALLDESLIGNTDSSLFFSVMLQALAQSKHNPLMKANIDRSSKLIVEKMVSIVIEAKASGEAAQDEPDMLVMAYLSLIQGLYTFQERSVLRRMTPEILLSVLRK